MQYLTCGGKQINSEAAAAEESAPKMGEQSCVL